MIAIQPSLRSDATTSQLSGKQQARLLLRVMAFVLPFWDKLLLRVILGLLGAFLAVVPAVLGGHLIDQVFRHGGVFNVVYYAALIMASGLLFHTLNTLSWWVADYLTYRVAMDLKLRFYRHVQRLSLRFFYTRPVGEHMYRATADVDTTVALATTFIPSLVIFQQLAVFGFLLGSIDVWILFVAVAYLVLFFAGRQWFVTRLRRWDFLIRAQAGRLEAVLRENLAANKTTQAYERRPTTQRWYSAYLLTLARSMFRRGVWGSGDRVFQNVFVEVGPVTVTLIVGLLVIEKRHSVGDYYIVSTVFAQLMLLVRDVIALFQGLRLQLVAAERMFHTLDLEPEIADAPTARPLVDFRGNIDLRDVEFAYDAVPVLRNVTIEARPGQKVALVGRSGSGKSTVAKLLLRLYDVDKGQVLIDGNDVRDLTQDSLRNTLGTVLQDPFVFAGTIFENIRYGAPNASEHDVLRSAAIAHVDDFVKDFPARYQTRLSEGGALSGGQRQRICLARTLVRSPRALILDEATSALDPMTERRVVVDVDEAFRDATRIVVAHNLGTIVDADRIYVFDKGRVVESGTHDELVSANGYYCRLWNDERSEV